MLDPQGYDQHNNYFNNAPVSAAVGSTVCKKMSAYETIDMHHIRAMRIEAACYRYKAWQLFSCCLRRFAPTVRGCSAFPSGHGWLLMLVGY